MKNENQRYLYARTERGEFEYNMFSPWSVFKTIKIVSAVPSISWIDRLGVILYVSRFYVLVLYGVIDLSLLYWMFSYIGRGVGEGIAEVFFVILWLASVASSCFIYALFMGFGKYRPSGWKYLVKE